MPNFVNNSFTFQFNSKENYELFKSNYVKNDNELLETICPGPKDIEIRRGWNIDNWGTKWEVDAELNFDDDSLSVFGSFDSAWSPPIEAYKYLNKHWNAQIEASYVEPGQEFCGIVDFTDIEQKHDAWEFEEFKEYVEENRLSSLEQDLWQDVRIYTGDDDDNVI